MKTIKESDYKKLVIESNKPVLIDFYADWCGPCKKMSSVLDTLAEEYKDKADIYKINADECENLTAELNVISLPTIVFFKNGKETERLMGLQSIEKIRNILNK